MKPDRLDQWTRALMVLTILAVAVFAFVQSFTHLYVLGWTHHQTGAANRLFPLSVDWVMLAAGLAMLHLDRKGLRHPLPRLSLALGATVTLAANIASGLIWGWEAALIAAWAPVALFVTIELGMVLVRSAHVKPAKPELSDGPVAGPDMETMERILASLPTEKRPRPVPPELSEAVDGPGDAIQGWGQLGRQEPAGQGLQGIGLANGRK